jgi:hypothetical protein
MGLDLIITTLRQAKRELETEGALSDSIGDELTYWFPELDGLEKLQKSVPQAPWHPAPNGYQLLSLPLIWKYKLKMASVRFC